MSLIKASLLSFDLSRVTHQLWVTYFLTDRFFPGKTQAWWFFKQKLAWKGGVHVHVCACACVCWGWCICDVQEGRRGRKEIGHPGGQGTQRRVSITWGLLLMAKDSSALTLLGSVHLTCSSLPSCRPLKSVLRFHSFMEPPSLPVSTESAFIPPAFV